MDLKAENSRLECGRTPGLIRINQAIHLVLQSQRQRWIPVAIASSIGILGSQAWTAAQPVAIQPPFPQISGQGLIPSTRPSLQSSIPTSLQSSIRPSIQLSQTPPKLKQPQTKRIFRWARIKPGSRPGGRLYGGSTRTAELNPCKSEPGKYAQLTALSTSEASASASSQIPTRHVWGQTQQSHPTLWFYLPYIQSPGPVEFELRESQTEVTLYQTTFQVPRQASVVGVAVPKTAPGLEPQRSYRWMVKLPCDGQVPTLIEGSLERIAPAPQQNHSAQRSPDPSRYYQAAIDQGRWFDALDSLLELKRAAPQDEQLQQEWEDLLSSAQLPIQVAQVPILVSIDSQLSSR
jgi:hypothetical protein